MPVKSAATSGLPAAFLEAVRGLFDMLDPDSKGWISLKEISSNWEENAPSPDLPRDVLSSLAKAADSAGRLTFERFCGGLKIAILRHEAERHRVVAVSSESDGSFVGQNARHEVSHHRSPSLSSSPQSTTSSTSQLSSSSPLAFSRASSLPNVFAAAHLSPLSTEGPPKPPRDFKKSSTDLQDRDRSSRRDSLGRRRRRTLQDGLDSDQVRRLSRLDDEKSVVEEGLLAAEAAAEYYRRRMREVQLEVYTEERKISSPSSSEAHMERLNFELQSIRELNDRLGSLSGGLPYRQSVEVKQLQIKQLQQLQQLEQRHQAEMSVMSRQVERLKMQNKLLTEEVGKKSNAVTNLEQEKSLLIKQLFQARSSMAFNNNSNRQYQQGNMISRQLSDASTLM